MVLAHSEDEVEDGDESADGVGVSSQHDIAEADVVVGGDVARGDAGECALAGYKQGDERKKGDGDLLCELDVVEHFEGEGEVAEEGVDAEEADKGEVAEHAVEWFGAVGADEFSAQVSKKHG